MTEVPYGSEQEMYQPVVDWFGTFLGGRLRQASVEVHDTHRFRLSNYIRRHALQEYFDSDIWQTFEIHVDVTGFIRTPKAKGLAFVECKLDPISVGDLSQLLGYSRVAKPLYSYLLSPEGVSAALKSLVLLYDRSDVLEYDWVKGQHPKTIVLAKWLPASRSLDATSILPPGA